MTPFGDASLASHSPRIFLGGQLEYEFIREAEEIQLHSPIEISDLNIIKSSEIDIEDDPPSSDREDAVVNRWQGGSDVAHGPHGSVIMSDRKMYPHNFAAARLAMIAAITRLC